MKYEKLFRTIWFKNESERVWFASQLGTYYETYRKSVVLYALKRLTQIFRMPFTSLDGGNELIALHDIYTKSNKRHWVALLLPMEFHRNPLQIIEDDYSYADDAFNTLERRSVQSDVPTLSPLNEHSTVADYVRFIVEYDAICRQTDRLRVTSALGATSP